MQPIKRFGGIEECTEHWGLMLPVIRYSFFQDHRTHISGVICLKTAVIQSCFSLHAGFQKSTSLSFVFTIIIC